MENVPLIGLSRQIALRRQMEVVANNMANMNTTGFKAEQLLFEEYLMPVARDRDFPALDQQLSFTDDWATVHDFSPGPVVDTGNPLDVALKGEGFLVVQTPAGEMYTKAGSLGISREGQLVDPSGYPIMGEGGPIQFLPNENGVQVADDGTISSDQGIKGKLRIVEFPDPQNVERFGENLWQGGTPQPATSTTIQQGSIEKSNVSGVSQMSQMLEIQRAYESVANLLQRHDEQRRSAIQKLGSLNG
jgi:flagellar basal-body rod protein FlgF